MLAICKRAGQSSAVLSSAAPNSHAQTLSPSRLVEMLTPRWSFDQAYAADSVAYDVYVHPQRAALCLEFTRAGKTTVLEVRPHDGGPAAAKAHGLVVSYERTASSQPQAKALCDQVAADLRTWHQTQERAPRWLCPHSRDTPLPGALALEVQVRPLAVPVERELARDMNHYEALYGSRPTARELLVRGKAIGVSVHYPAPSGGTVPASAAIYPGPALVRRRRRLRLHFAELGCVFDEEGMPRTVPTPATLRSALESRHEKFIPLRWVKRRGLPMEAREWVAYVLRERTLPITLAPRFVVYAHRALRRLVPSSTIPVDVGMLVHDASVHGLVFSDIDAALWDEFSRHAKSIHRRGRRQAFAVARFYEETLTNACWRTWRSVDEPARFSERFNQEVDALREALNACGA